MNAFKTEHLTKRYSGTAALNDVSLTVEYGRITGLLGPNGSGKTTLIKIAAGVLSPTSGSCEIAGYKPGKKSKALVSYLPDRNYLPDWMNITKLLDLFSDFYKDFDRTRADFMLNELNLNRSLTIKQMSKGAREKLQLILVMSRKAKVYLLDEPLSGVDPATRDYILNTILRNYDPDSAVLISTHLIADVESILDDVIFINNGNLLLSSSVDEIREKHGKSVDEYFREVFRV